MRGIAIVGLIALGSCGRADDPTLREELAAQSRGNGLALTEIRGDQIAVVPFGANERYFRSEYGQALTEVFESDGTSVLWYPGSMLGGARQAVVKTITGDVIATVTPGVREFFPCALNRAAGRLAYWGTDGVRDSREGLRWASFDFSAGGFVDFSDGDLPCADWSPDGSQLAYAKKGRMFIFDVSKTNAELLTEGRNPMWNPKGDRISFRAPDGKTSLITAAEHSLIGWPLSRYQTIGAIRWSPDGGYVSVPTTVAHPFPLIGAYYELLVCRVADGRCIVARKFGPGIGDVVTLDWILDYQRFCVACLPGEPFN